MPNNDIVKYNGSLLKRLENAVGVTNKLLNIDFRKINVVYFDDHPVYMRGVRLALKPLLPNIYLKEFTCGSEALIYVENCFKTNQKMDIIITGIYQPGDYDGFDFAKAIRDIEVKYNRNTPIMIISMCVGEDFAPKINKALDDRLWNAAFSKAATSEKICECIKFLIENPNEIIKYDEDSVLVNERRQTEKELLTFLCKNYELNKISEKMDLSSRTIEALKNQIMKRYGVENLEHLIIYAKENNLID